MQKWLDYGRWFISFVIVVKMGEWKFDEALLDLKEILMHILSYFFYENRNIIAKLHIDAILYIKTILDFHFYM